ncbi:hypothetical protein GCM10011331_21110 [Flavimobilis marinus]|uniref:Uncharacterized protein n=1 Tax=Flavimobilis marinus TaxID=285351 RepID=A0A1I2H0H3_9MICO|nr:hypothetical protein [Flavimobilis marinus]GHG54910.1 hypothetical protein GCM10011331_21110 [Flavimobilis marinus]SFF22241.1 hypothetical protein SAMN04488035_2061 [Flavimobilis marinus]
MTQHHGGSRPDDLPEILRAIADDAAASRLAGSAPDDEFLIGVRRRATAVRRRRNARQGMVAAVCVAAVGVGGVVIAQNVGTGGGAIAPATTSVATAEPTSGAFPLCGAAVPGDWAAGDVRLVSQAHLDEDGMMLSASRPGDAPFATDVTLSELIPLMVLNDGEETVTVGSTGYATVVLVKDGVVVAGPGMTPEPYTEPTVEPGGAVPVTATLPDPCDGEPIADGQYEAYAILDAQVGATGGEPAATQVVGGPWLLEVGASETPGSMMALQCDDEVSEVPRWVDPIHLDVTLPQGPAVAGDSRALRVDLFNATDSPANFAIDGIETYLVRGGKVVASTEVAVMPYVVEIPGGQAYGDGHFPGLPSADCAGDPVAPGDYSLYIITEFADPATTLIAGTQTQAISGPHEITIAGDASGEGVSNAALPELDPDAEFPMCGAAVPDEAEDTFGIETVLEIPGVKVADPTKPDWITAAGMVTNTTRDTLLGNSSTSVPAVLVQDGRVVSIEPYVEADAKDFSVAPRESFELEVTATTVHCGRSAIEALPPGTYEVWGYLDTYVKERQNASGSATSVNEKHHAVARLGEVTINH